MKGLLILALMFASHALLARGVRPVQDLPTARIWKSNDSKLDAKHRKHKTGYTSPTGVFIQERASKQLPGPGQHFAFGAMKPWADIHKDYLTAGSKLLLVIRHGQAVSNYLSETLGPDAWFGIEETCSYKDTDNKTWGIFDADLTDLGQDQAKALNSLLTEVGWFAKLTVGKPAVAVVSPLSRCLETARASLRGLSFARTAVEEYVRETLGEDTCDARRSMSDPQPEAAVGRKKPHKKHHGAGPCEFEQGLRSKFPDFKFHLKGNESALGLLTDEDSLWTVDDREKQKHQVKRAKKFLDAVFAEVEEQVLFVVSHSGFTRSLLLAVGREPYRPVNAELVPVVVERLDDRG